MSRAPRLALLVALSLLASFAAVRIIDEEVSHQTPGPEDASRPPPDEAGAAWSLLRDAVATPAATARARRLLARDPALGWPFAVIARTASPRDRELLHRIAVRRAPRLVEPRVWLANEALRAGRFDDAMREIDILLRLAPPYREPLYPLLTRMARDDAFADALARRLRQAPMWRAEYVATLSKPGATTLPLMAWLASRGALGSDGMARWIDAASATPDAPAAYAAWLGSLPLDVPRVPHVYNGDFGHPPSGRGFDWRATGAAGVALDVAPLTGSKGAAARSIFRGAPAADAGLIHPLVLAPGHYRFYVRMRATALEGEGGLQWRIRCAGSDSPVLTGARLTGTFDWSTLRVDFDVPDAGCPVQQLELVNFAPGGAAQALAGDVAVDDIVIRRLDTHPSTPGLAALEGRRVVAFRADEAGFARIGRGARLAGGERVAIATPAVVAYEGGCAERFDSPVIITVDPVRCAHAAARVGAVPERAVSSRIRVLQEAERWYVPPIGR